jgi:hypothetical protein
LLEAATRQRAPIRLTKLCNTTHYLHITDYTHAANGTRRY